MSAGSRRVLTPGSHDLPAGLTAEAWRTAVAEAAREWSAPRITCTSVELVVAAPAPRRTVAQDGLSLLTFRGAPFCHNDDCGHGRTYPATVMAMTTVFPDGARGAAVVEADVELNAGTFRFAPFGTETNPLTVPLKAVLVHEIGHVLGFEDACGGHWHDANRGCPDGPPESVMYAPALREELTPLDVAALCAAFPKTEETSAGAPRACGCHLPGSAPPRESRGLAVSDRGGARDRTPPPPASVTWHVARTRCPGMNLMSLDVDVAD